MLFYLYYIFLILSYCTLFPLPVSHSLEPTLIRFHPQWNISCHRYRRLPHYWSKIELRMFIFFLGLSAALVHVDHVLLKVFLYLVVCLPRCLPPLSPLLISLIINTIGPQRSLCLLYSHSWNLNGKPDLSHLTLPQLLNSCMPSQTGLSNTIDSKFKSWFHSHPPARLFLCSLAHLDKF